MISASIDDAKSIATLLLPDAVGPVNNQTSSIGGLIQSAKDEVEVGIIWKVKAVKRGFEDESILSMLVGTTSLRITDGLRFHSP